MKTENDVYSDFLLNKRVVIVGPAPSMIGSRQGKTIDEFDVVVRIKKVLSKFDSLSEDIGTRTDILYSWLDQSVENGGAIDFEALKENNVKFVCCPYPRGLNFSNRNINAFLRDNKGRFRFHAIDRSYYLNIVDRIKTRPNSGIGAIMDILIHKVSELYITGFTFFKGGYIKEYTDMDERQAFERMAKYGFHSQPPQIELIREIVKNDKRVKVDDTLRKILEV